MLLFAAFMLSKQGCTALHIYDMIFACDYLVPKYLERYLISFMIQSAALRW